MGEDLPQRAETRVAKTTGADVATAAARAGLGLIPVVGPVVTEIVTTLIPGQRIQRIHSFLEAVASRVENLEADTFESRMTTPEGIDLLEDCMAQAARALSDERIGYLANLLATGVSSETVDHETSKKMAELLGQLTDAEVVWLGAYGHYVADETYWERHAVVLSHRFASLDGTEEDFDAAAIQRSHTEKLERLGLVERPEWPGEPRMTEPQPQVTWLGAMVLNYVGMPCHLRSPREGSQGLYIDLVIG